MWAYQFTPHDNWDYDATSAMILVDLTIGGKARKVLVTFNKNGFQYTLDRATGEVLAAKPYVHVNWAKSVDLKTGRPVVDPTKETGASKGMVKDICPSLEGGVSPASPAAYSPRTGLFYTSINNLCMDFGSAPAARIAGTPYMGAGTPYHLGPESKNLGAFIAWDAATGKRVWEIAGAVPRLERCPGHRGRRGVLRHPGRLFQVGRREDRRGAVEVQGGLRRGGQPDHATAAPTASSTWPSTQGSAVTPISSRGTCVSGDQTDVRPPADFMKDIGRHTSQGGMVWIFGL